MKKIPTYLSRIRQCQWHIFAHETKIDQKDSEKKITFELFTRSDGLD
jgi:hypothetical protein